tara:strand:+ start:222 stop:503 length:282 start_codon:yes stop_codon:yes gene_type:complete
MNRYYATGISAYGHDGADYGSITIATHETYAEAQQHAHHLMTLTPDDVLLKHAEGELGTGEDARIESIFIDRWFVTDKPDESFRPVVWKRRVK